MSVSEAGLDRGIMVVKELERVFLLVCCLAVRSACTVLMCGCQEGCPAKSCQIRHERQCFCHIVSSTDTVDSWRGSNLCGAVGAKWTGLHFLSWWPSLWAIFTRLFCNFIFKRHMHFQTIHQSQNISVEFGSIISGQGISRERVGAPAQMANVCILGGSNVNFPI